MFAKALSQGQPQKELRRSSHNTISQSFARTFGALLQFALVILFISHWETVAGLRDFPENTEVFIGLRDTDLVLDESGGSTEPDTAVILYTRKNEGNENQKWIYENKQIRNKASGLAVTFPALRPNVAANVEPPEGKASQKFEYYDYVISAMEDEDLVLGIVGGKADGARLALVPRDNDSDLQLWDIIT